ncbi:MAG: SprT [Bacteroidota bacterium]|jgi:hypothetical protein
MKQLFSIVLLFCTLSIQAQFRQSIFSKNPVIHLENWQQKRVYFGFFLGLNSYDFKFDYNKVIKDIQVKKTTGFNVGLVADLRLHEYINLRFEPGLYYTKRILNYPTDVSTSTKPAYFLTAPIAAQTIREVNSTYIHLPLLFKFSSLRTGNIRPYLLGGFSTTLNLSSNSKSADDNSQQRFRVKAWSPNYELGFGIDIFSEYFIFSPSVRGVFGLKDELIRDNSLNGYSPWTGNIESMKTRGLFINFTFH